uniref:Homeobox domain-containing protein n=1 Tax=Strongyloides papillosus TaxID=174720 RepID=A0A0N5BN99_STREA
MKMYSNNLQSLKGLSELNNYGLIPLTTNHHNFEQKTNQINQFNNIQTFSTKNSMNMLNLLNNITLNSSNNLQKNVTSNLKNDFQISNLQVQGNTNEIDCLNFSMNNILNNTSPPKEVKIPNYTNCEWPIVNSNISVPYFNTELYNKVNFDSTWSERIDGSDLPYNDITTLRFFYNYGVNQFKGSQVNVDTGNGNNFNLPSVSKISNSRDINTTSYYSNSKLLPSSESKPTFQNYQNVDSIIGNQKILLTNQQHLSNLKNDKSNKSSSKEVTTKSLNKSTSLDDQTMPCLEPQVSIDSSSIGYAKHNAIRTSPKQSMNVYQTSQASKSTLINTNIIKSRQLASSIDESVSKTFNITLNDQITLSTFPLTNLVEEKSLKSSLICNISKNCNFIFDSKKSSCTYSKLIPVTIIEKIVCTIKSTIDKRRCTTNTITFEDSFRIIKNYKENQIKIENIEKDNKKYKIEHFTNDKYIFNHKESNTTPTTNTFNTFLQPRTSKKIKRPREITSLETDFKYDYSNDNNNSFIQNKNLEPCPLKRSKKVDVDENNDLAKCIEKLDNIKYSSDVNEEDSENFDVITSSIEPKLLQALERLTISYCNGRHYVIEKYNNTLQKAIDNIVSQELFEETPTPEELSNLSSDIENFFECSKDYKSDLYEDSKIIRYVIKTPDSNNTLNQDIENVSVEEKKKFEADVIQEALDKHLIKPVETNNSSQHKIKIKAYVAMPFFNNYLHFITNEYLKQIENDSQNSNSNSQTFNENIPSDLDKSFKLNNLSQNQIQKPTKNDLSIVPIPIRAVSLNNNFYEVSIKKIQNEKFEKCK